MEEAKKCKMCMNFVSDDTINVGTTIGDYTITDSLGEGAFADVFKAKYAFMDRFVAIKVLKRIIAKRKKFWTVFSGKRESGSI
ncbi:MAG: hypothetical protein WA705_29085 [Candidatus Ozemobacteraceae bacterium]